jgi:hypothetical protein
VRAFPRMVVLATAAGLLWPAAARAQMEHEVKAAYLFKFLSYVEWPAGAFGGAETPFVIGVLDAEEVRISLAEIVRNRRAQGRPIEVRRLEKGEAPEGMHAVFVGRAAAEGLPRLVGRPGLLIVGEDDWALDRGAMINLLRIENRVRFEVAPLAADRSGLHISSRLLVLAHGIKAEMP